MSFNERHKQRKPCRQKQIRMQSGVMTGSVLQMLADRAGKKYRIAVRIAGHAGVAGCSGKRSRRCINLQGLKPLHAGKRLPQAGNGQRNRKNDRKKSCFQDPHNRNLIMLSEGYAVEMCADS